LHENRSLCDTAHNLNFITMPRSTSTPSAQRPYDVVLYGATGFVGQQTVAYFAKHSRGVNWAIAGRSRSKLEAVLRDSKVRVPIIVADAHDAPALSELAASTRVVLSTAGPFGLYGSTLVAACVQQRTHYVDITGETPWVREMIDAHHAQAALDGTRIIPGCGFDSVPSDLGAYVVAQEMLRRHGVPCADIKASFTLRGGINGGTLASVLDIMGKGQTQAFTNAFLLNPEHQPSPADTAHQDPTVPHRDADFDAWHGPFFMGPVNTRVVRRSAALYKADAKASGPSGYAEDFHYQEYLRFGKGALAATLAAGMSAGSVAGQAALRFAPVRKLTAALVPKPGQGPSQRAMDGGSFRCQLIGKPAQGDAQKFEVRAVVSDQGDPGNRATTKMVCESALALACDTLLLPGGVDRGGVLTPAYALGDVLVQRLRAAGMHVEIIDAES
jgi:short subunit dehydrogenase-like uncharacterized protein